MSKWHSRIDMRPYADLTKGHIGAYERLLLLNQHAGAIIEILAAWGANDTISPKDATYYGLMVAEVRASASQCVVENLDEREVQLASKASKARLNFEKKLFGA